MDKIEDKESKCLIQRYYVPNVLLIIRKNMRIDCMEEQRYRRPRDSEICSKW